MHNEDTHRTSGWSPPRTAASIAKRSASTSPEHHEHEGAIAPRTRPQPARSVEALSLAFFDDSTADETPVSEIMSKKVLTAPSDMPLDVLAYVMIDQQVGGTPVVDETGRPIGMISKTDLLRELRDLADGARAAWDPWDAEEGDAPRTPLPMESLSSRTAIDAMTPIVYWLPEDASIAQAAALMAYEHVHGIPVVNKAGKVSGLVSTLDVLRWFARRRGYLIPK